ncbi:sodium:solute symporter family protein [Phaeocystidibacter luteus]|uniref:Na+:solute symporter n=1 Tax=Phaeocystidibacter luteus TaxID=911197 RepID=A0A6N6RI15_9FLAO|nr:sodium:solute symporter family protein [Phaeocystidibacter luteus]KAB2813914.1 Na+:solute symporter [Phaeocystidibacter luteus]
MQQLDWILFGLLAALMIGAGLWASKKSGKDLNSYFLGGRNLPWWMAGISMVATTFAADTPLAVTELIHDNGISGNWIWWNLLAGGMLTTFFFANLWRRSGVLTEVELIQLRYSSPAARFLRPFKSIYLGLFMNVLIIGWVNLAMVTILAGFFGMDEQTAFLYTGLTMLAVTLYSAFSGLLGVVITDNIQFVIAMVGSIALAYFVLDSPQIGGIENLKAQLPDSAFSFFPSVGEGEGQVYSITATAFFAFFGMMWWASWYPGAEPGGGGYIAQRMMSTKDEKSAVYSTLFFQIAHYCIRPWPWILVGLSALVLFNVPNKLDESSAAQWNTLAEHGPVAEWIDNANEAPEELRPDVLQLAGQLEVARSTNPSLDESIRYESDSRFGYIFALKNHVPAGWMGVLLVGFFAAYMSTISTQLNWGASYLVNDFYLPIKNRKKEDQILDSTNEQSGRTLVNISRVTVVLLAVVGLTISFFIESISSVWSFIMECGAGLGLVLILRWFWWRINAWSELSATIAPFIGYAISKFGLGLEFPDSFFVTVSFTTIVWLVVTFLTPAESDETLQKFYNRIKPAGNWGRFAETQSSDLQNAGHLARLAVCWIAAVSMTYSLLFMMGKIIFMEWQWAGIYGAIVLVSGLILNVQLKKTKILK